MMSNDGMVCVGNWVWCVASQGEAPRPMLCIAFTWLDWWRRAYWTGDAWVATVFEHGDRVGWDAVGLCAATPPDTHFTPFLRHENQDTASLTLIKVVGVLGHPGTAEAVLAQTEAAWAWQRAGTLLTTDPWQKIATGAFGQEAIAAALIATQRPGQPLRGCAAVWARGLLRAWLGQGVPVASGLDLVRQAVDIVNAVRLREMWWRSLREPVPEPFEPWTLLAAAGDQESWQTMHVISCVRLYQAGVKGRGNTSARPAQRARRSVGVP